MALSSTSFNQAAVAESVALFTLAYLGGGGGKGGANAPPLWRLAMYFCIHNCTSPSNDYAAVACSNNSQAQLYTLTYQFKFLTVIQTFD